MTGSYVSVRIAGGLVPPDLLARVVAARDLPGMGSADYHLASGETVREAANRAWGYLTGVWSSYRAALEALPKTDLGTRLTRERWLLLLLRELGYGRVPTTPAGGLVVDATNFPVSHEWQDVPVHLLGWRVDLDRRTPGVAGAAGSAPQSLVQDLLNRSPERLFGILSNGRVLRLLRDSTSLVGAAFIEFDLESMFDGELFADFVLLFSLAHESRLAAQDEPSTPESCWLEQWRLTAALEGTRALDDLRDGVVQALQALGTGFLRHPANTALREGLAAGRATGGLELEDYRQVLLRAAYRLLFLFVAEDRGALLDPQSPAVARATYDTYFSTSRLRRLARRWRGTRHADLWRSLTLVMTGLGTEGGRPELGITPLGGLFEAYGPAGEDGVLVDALAGLELANEDLLAAIRALSLLRDSGGRLRAVDYRHLGSEELGGIYESLLEYIPRHDPATREFHLELLSGNERKTTGSYYTPTSLIDVLLDSALEPVLDEAQKSSDPRAALLAVTVCDPACGSGHFLVGAGRRIAKRIAAIDSGDPEPGPDTVRSALREVVTSCLYGVDINPLAIELTKISLWLESLIPGQPLAFLDPHLRVGNALLGAGPALLAGGIPDAAFKPIEGDDKRWAAALGTRNRNERSHNHGQVELIGHSVVDRPRASLPQLAGASSTYADVQLAARQFRALLDDPVRQAEKLLADAWCAAFVWTKRSDAPPAVTTATLSSLASAPADVPASTLAEITRLATEYRFFHWSQEFPEIFRQRPGVHSAAELVTGWAGGFSCVLGNPPWEHTELKEREFFATRAPVIATAAGSARKTLIKALAVDDPDLDVAFREAKRMKDALPHFARASGRFPLCARGRINTYALFAETDRAVLGPAGRLGVILPTGIATDATTQYFFRDVVTSGSLAALYDFENAQPLFAGVHRSFKFVLLTLAGQEGRETAADFAFFTHDPAQLARPGFRFSLTPEEITLLNPNTGTCPIFRTRRDAEITLGIYRRVPVLIREGDPNGNPWGLSFMQGLFNMTSDSHLFRTREELEADGWTLRGNTFERDGSRMLPLYEAKMTAAYDHRAADVIRSATATQRQNQPSYLMSGEKQDPARFVLPMSWVVAHEVKVGPWLVGFCDITSPTNERTFVAAAIPGTAVGNKFILLDTESRCLPVLYGNLNSFIFDFVTRQKLGGITLNFFYVKQLPALPPSTYNTICPWQPSRRLDDWFIRRVKELSYTAWDMQTFALDLHDVDPPFVWDDERRAVLRSELDAAYFHLYGLARDDVEYVLGTFPIVKRKDDERFGEFRTARLVMAAYDAMAAAMAGGPAYESQLEPPPGDGPRHPQREGASA